MIAISKMKYDIKKGPVNSYITQEIRKFACNNWANLIHISFS